MESYVPATTPRKSRLIYQQSLNETTHMSRTPRKPRKFLQTQNSSTLLLVEHYDRDSFIQSPRRCSTISILQRPNVPPPPPPPPLFSLSSPLTPSIPIGFECLMKYEHKTKRGFENFIFRQDSDERSCKKSMITVYTEPKKTCATRFLFKIPQLFMIFVKFLKKYLSILMTLFTFLLCICFIISFQKHVHDYYKSLLDTNVTTSAYASDLVNRTVYLCNSPYFSYQINNLAILPFSLTITLIFSFFGNERNNVCCGLPSHINPFQKRNRFLTAALFCILANEIFKLIEASLFQKEKSFNSTENMFLYLRNNTSSSSSRDIFAVGFGMEPQREFNNSSLSSLSTNRPFIVMAPITLKYLKPSLPPRIDTQKSLHYEVRRKVEKLRNKTLKILNMTEQMLNVTSEEIVEKSYNFALLHLPSFKWSLIWVKFEKLAILVVEVLVIGMRYYPLLGILDKKSSLCLFFGALYTWFDLIYNVATTGLCEGLKINITFDIFSNFQGLIKTSTHDNKLLFSTKRIFYTVIKSLPHFYCLSYVCVRLTKSFIHQVFSNKSQKSLDNYETNDFQFLNPNKWSQTNGYLMKRNELNDEKLSFEEKYVQTLLAKPKVHLYLSKKPFQKWLKMIQSDSFRYSSRVICSYTVCATVLYYLTCFLVFYGSIIIDFIQLPSIFKHTLLLSALISLVIAIYQLIMSLYKFKINIIALYKGKSTLVLPKSNIKIALGSFNYAGYLVTYTCWGYLILFVFVFLISFQISTLLQYGTTQVSLFVTAILIPLFLSILLFKFINRLVNGLAARFCFLQAKSKHLALKNYRFYSLFLYFKFFYDCFTGIASCLLRLAKSLLLGILFMSRMDYSFMGRSLEKYDTAFMSYVGFLHWEAAHTNPIVISFCKLIKAASSTNGQNDLNSCRTRIMNKWKLMLMLSKNKSLIKYRKRRDFIL